ncbi:hypothetical protein [Pedobacter aquatilis]|uniref:hypothetical protein n=1 Tax=Pedobacter aquatilis TaxID=351343 RepID=UPI00292E38B7|nr:hypothetical protein [Pedobacter aquatilis]
MKRKPILILIFISVIVLLSNCKKHEIEENGALDYLTKRTWKRAAVDKNPGSNPLLNIYFLPLECEKDDVYSFCIDGTMKIDNGTEKCDAKENKIEMGSYDITKSEITIKGVKYILTEVSPQQIKYVSLVSSQVGYYYAVMLLQ